MLDFFKPKGAAAGSQSAHKLSNGLKRSLPTKPSTPARPTVVTGNQAVIKLESDDETPPEKRQHVSPTDLGVKIESFPLSSVKHELPSTCRAATPGWP